MSVPKKIEISYKTIVFTVAFLVSLGFLYYIREILLNFFVALVIMAIFNPTVTRLSKYKIPRALSIFVVYVLFFTIIGVVVAGLLPALIEQTTSLVNGLPLYVQELHIPEYIGDQLGKEILAQLGNLPEQVLKIGISLFSNVLSVFLILIFAFYLLLARERLGDQLGEFFDKGRKKQVLRFVDALEAKLGGWARGQLVLMVLVGTTTYIGLTMLSIPYVLPLALLAGLLEIVPYIGPFLSALPAVVVGFGISPVMGLAVLALVFLIQQVENYVFVPKVMEKSAGVNPIVTLLALTIGFRIAGVAGAILSIPVVITLKIAAKEFFMEK